MTKIKDLTNKYKIINDDRLTSILSTSTTSSNINKIPSKFIGPITKKIMNEPVLFVSDGHIYEKEAIIEYLKTNKKSPLTGEIVDDNAIDNLFPDIKLQTEIQTYLIQSLPTNDGNEGEIEN